MIDDGNRSFKGGDEINGYNMLFITPVHNITSTQEGLLFTSGEFVTQDIAYTNLRKSNSLILTYNY
ncbi:hypothetical protein CJF42_14970 [Pseudoalteromonas sp. NBT06-2]|nr:hypothetical protein CJF42_14970 [Pseudoalteromonas sp. NBT06-2]